MLFLNTDSKRQIIQKNHPTVHNLKNQQKSIELYSKQNKLTH